MGVNSTHKGNVGSTVSTPGRDPFSRRCRSDHYLALAGLPFGKKVLVPTLQKDRREDQEARIVQTRSRLAAVVGLGCAAIGIDVAL